MTKKEANVAITAIILLGVVIGTLIWRDIISVGDALQVIILFFLALATLGYVTRTKDMAEEMREQRLGEARPYLLLRLANEIVQWKNAEDDFIVTVFNAGKGPAMNLNAGLWRHDDIFAVDTKGYLAPDQEWGATINRSSTDGIALGEKVPYPQLKDKVHEKSVVVVEYEDIHHLRWISHLSFEDMDGTGYVRDGVLNIMELKDND